jgi:uncharacterized membrane protein (GlpM family)
MQFVIKLFISMCILVFCGLIGRKMPSLAGLIAVMPLTGLIAMLWLYSGKPGDFATMTEYTKAAVWGSLASALFFLAAFLCFRRHSALWLVLCVSFGVWLVAAFLHQWLLRRPN